jgi:hypothetical protein
MDTRKTRAVSCALFAVLLMIPRLWALDTASARATLAGVPAVYVLVEDLSDELKKTGLSEAILQTDAELRLRAVGIRVATETESFSVAGSPYLYLRVTGMASDSRGGYRYGYVAYVEVALRQDVSLIRNPSTHAVAETWTKGTLIAGPTVDVIRDAVRDMTDGFANAYLAANPKR